MPLSNYAVDTGALLAVFRAQRTFVITSHARPDGDAIGSSLALMHLLDAMAKEVTVCFADPIPQIYSFIPGIERICPALPTHAVDCAILLECGSVARSGFPGIDARILINIDHHLSGRNFADHNWMDPEAVAVGAMIYELAMASGQSITPQIATCLYTAVLTDTGGFTYGRTTASTFGLAQHLLESGADAQGTTQAIYFSNPPSKMRLLGVALNRMRIDDAIAWSWVTKADMDASGATVEDCEGVVNFLIGMAGICAAGFLREEPGGAGYRISLRSKDQVDVAAVAGKFSGGGHRNASGGSIHEPLETALAQVVAALHAACAASYG
jgi:phosphoesterase RecJ-like protein